MGFELIFRLIGLVVFGIVGWQSGISLSGGQYEIQQGRYVIVLSLAGAMLGFMVAPYITVRPFRSARAKMRQLPAQTLVAAFIGLVFGLIVSLLLSFPLSLLPNPLGQVLPLASALIFGYISIAVMVTRQRDIFNVIGRNAKGADRLSSLGQSRSGFILLDTNVIIDGRIADICQTGFILDELLVPRFVLNEVQYFADSNDSQRRTRGRRGLEILNRLQRESDVPVRITDMDVEDARQVDDKLVLLAKQLHCPIMTNDYNLNRVAELQGVRVMNINELANAVKMVYLPGESLEVHIIQEGKEIGQGVGYLDDGTMVVIEDGYGRIGETVVTMVTKVLQTAAGRMIFARLDNG